MRVIIIGGGIAGLGAATYFARKGHDVEVLEASTRVAGRAVTLRSRRGDCADAGTQYFHTNYRRARRLMQPLGLDTQLSKVTGRTRFFDTRSAGGYFDVSHRWPWFPPAGLHNLAATGLVVRALMSRSEVFGLDHPAKLDEIDAWEALTSPFLREFVLRPLLLAGALAEPAVARPSLLHLLRLFRIVVLTDYLVLPGGIASFAEALAAHHRVLPETPARRLVVEGNTVVGVEIEGSGRVVRADHTIIALPPRRAAALLPDGWRDEKDYLGSITMPPFTLVSLFLDRPLDRGIWSYVLPAQSDGNIGFLTDAARKSPAMVPSGRSVLQAWCCYPASKRLVGLANGAIVDAVRRELETHLPGLSSWIDEAQVTHHPFAVPFHAIGHQRRTLAFLRSADTRNGVSFCGDYLSGGFMEAALWSAERAAQRHG